MRGMRRGVHGRISAGEPRQQTHPRDCSLKSRASALGPCKAQTGLSGIALNGGKPTLLATPLPACCVQAPNACGGREAELLPSTLTSCCWTGVCQVNTLISWSGAGAGIGTEWARRASKRRSAAEAGQAALHEGHVRATGETVTTMCAAQPRCRAWPQCGMLLLAPRPLHGHHNGRQGMWGNLAACLAQVLRGLRRHPAWMGLQGGLAKKQGRTQRGGAGRHSKVGEQGRTVSTKGDWTAESGKGGTGCSRKGLGGVGGGAGPGCLHQEELDAQNPRQSQTVLREEPDAHTMARPRRQALQLREQRPGAANGPPSCTQSTRSLCGARVQSSRPAGHAGLEKSMTRGRLAWQVG